MRRARRWLLGVAVAAGFLGGLAACGDALRRERVAVCRRALPALAAPGARLLRAGAGSAPGTVRVDYAEGGRPHWFTCRFDSGASLTALAGDGVDLSGPALHMLRRYYLDTPDAAAADPAGR